MTALSGMDLAALATELKPLFDEIEGEPGERMTCALVAFALANGVDAETFRLSCETAHAAIGEMIEAQRKAAH